MGQHSCNEEHTCRQCSDEHNLKFS